MTDLSTYAGGPTSLEKDSVLGRIQRPTTPSNLNGSAESFRLRLRRVFDRGTTLNFLIDVQEKSYSNEENFRIVVDFIPDTNEEGAYATTLEKKEIFTLANKEKALKRVYAIFEEEIEDFLET